MSGPQEGQLTCCGSARWHTKLWGLRATATRSTAQRYSDAAKMMSRLMRVLASSNLARRLTSPITVAPDIICRSISSTRRTARTSDPCPNTPFIHIAHASCKALQSQILPSIQGLPLLSLEGRLAKGEAGGTASTNTPRHLGTSYEESRCPAACAIRVGWGRPTVPCCKQFNEQCPSIPFSVPPHVLVTEESLTPHFV